MSNFKVTGTLGRHAQARFSPDGTAWLVLEIHQGPNTLAVAARQRFDRTAASAIAVRNLAYHLRAGSRVTVHAERYEIVLRPTPHLLVEDAKHIERLAVAGAADQRSREAA